MFLNRLNDLEKKCFYRLAQLAAEVNGEIEYEESNYLELYWQEMALEKNDLAKIENLTPDDITKVFEKASDAHKRIVMFETIAFMYVDGSFDEEEREYTYRFAKQIGFQEESINRIVELVEDYVKYLIEIANEIL